MEMQFQQPLVSVGLPVYNGAATIEKTLKTLLLQDYKNIEIVISDNGSTDNTSLIVEKFAAQYSNISLYRSIENHGLIWNFNHVFQLSKGEYFMWASHDDEHASNYISKCLSEIQKSPNAALCSPNTIATWGRENSKIWQSNLGSFTKRVALKARYIETLRNFPAVALYGVYRSSMIKKTNLFPQAIGGDLLFIQNLSMYGDFIGIDENLFTYNQREIWNNASQDYRVFFGKGPKPIWYVPFFVFSYWQMKLLLKAKLRFTQKIQLLLGLIQFQLEQFFKKIGLKLIKYLLPKTIKAVLGRFFYWRYLHSPNIIVLDVKKFEERIIRPTLSIDK